MESAGPQIIPNGDDHSRQDLSRQFRQAAAMPAPERNLHLGQAGPLTSALLSDHTTIFFAETHDDTNYKFLADNPDIFKEAAAHGARYAFVELPIVLAPLFQAYFDGRIDAQRFEKMLSDLPPVFTSGDTSESYARSLAAFCQTVKESGMRVLPSDFRVMTTATEQSVTSDAFGVPDISGFNDETRNQTMLSLEMHRAATGQLYPESIEDLVGFFKLHEDRLKTLPPETLNALEKDKELRRMEWMDVDQDPNHVQSNDLLQFSYYSRLVEPEERSIFFGGAHHFTRADTLDDNISATAYGKVAGIYLLSDSGIFHDTHIASPFSDPASKAFDFTIHTERSLLFDRDLQPVASAPGESTPLRPTIPDTPSNHKPLRP